MCGGAGGGGWAKSMDPVLSSTRRLAGCVYDYVPREYAHQSTRKLTLQLQGPRHAPLGPRMRGVGQPCTHTLLYLYTHPKSTYESSFSDGYPLGIPYVQKCGPTGKRNIWRYSADPCHQGRLAKPWRLSTLACHRWGGATGLYFHTLCRVTTQLPANLETTQTR